MRGLRTICSLTTILFMLALLATTAVASPKERIDYWRNTYEELKPADDPRVPQAHMIFKRVRQAAGTKPGVVPRLFITKNEPGDMALPIALPDGWIILSKSILDICYRQPTWGDNRLAFVLAHEIAHQLKDDFWHMQFFQAIEASRTRDPQRTKYLEEVRRIAGTTDHIRAKELQADERGIVYASMAGFQTQAIVTEDDQVNFFREWIQARDPQRLEGISPDRVRPAPQQRRQEDIDLSELPAFGSSERSHPTPQQRAEALRARLRQILDKVVVFDVGLAFYQAGEYSRAILAFEHFLRLFPSREVYHNLAASHHQLALQFHRQWKGEEQALPFQLSLGVEPGTRVDKHYKRTFSPRAGAR